VKEYNFETLANEVEQYLLSMPVDSFKDYLSKYPEHVSSLPYTAVGLPVDEGACTPVNVFSREVKIPGASFALRRHTESAFLKKIGLNTVFPQFLKDFLSSDQLHPSVFSNLQFVLQRAREAARDPQNTYNLNKITSEGAHMRLFRIRNLAKELKRSHFTGFNEDSVFEAFSNEYPEIRLAYAVFAEGLDQYCRRLKATLFPALNPVLRNHFSTMTDQLRRTNINFREIDKACYVTFLECVRDNKYFSPLEALEKAFETLWGLNAFKIHSQSTVDGEFVAVCPFHVIAKTYEINNSLDELNPLGYAYNWALGAFES
jgi:hypothetical protein